MIIFYSLLCPYSLIEHIFYLFLFSQKHIFLDCDYFHKSIYSWIVIIFTKAYNQEIVIIFTKAYNQEIVIIFTIAYNHILTMCRLRLFLFSQ